MRRVGGAITLLLLWSGTGGAQVLVYDAANHQTNIFTGLQQHLNTVESVFHSLQWVEEMAGWEEHIDGGGPGVAPLENMIMESRQIFYDLELLRQQTNRLFALHTAPIGSTALGQRVAEIRRIRAEQQAKAREIQALGRTIFRMITNIRRLWERLLAMRGNKQGSQNIQHQLTRLNVTESELKAMISAYQQVELTEKQEEAVVAESLGLITDAVYATMPRP